MWLRVPSLSEPCGPPYCAPGSASVASTMDDNYAGWVYRQEHCVFKLWTVPAGRACLSGKWLMAYGDSNHQDTLRNLRETRQCVVNVVSTDVADAMKTAGVKLDYVLEIDVPFDAIVERISGRRSHPASGRTYHVKVAPPKIEGKDDLTGEDLVQRPDDQEATVQKRLDVYSAQTRPLVDYYSDWAAKDPAAAPKYRKISGMGSVEDITSRALQALSA